MVLSDIPNVALAVTHTRLFVTKTDDNTARRETDRQTDRLISPIST